MISPLYLYGNRILNEVCENVENPESSEVASLVADLKDTLEYYRGYGLSAPQIGIPKRVFIFHREIKGEAVGNIEVVINPVFIDKNGGFQRGPEGCLSFPGFQASRTRPNIVNIVWVDNKGIKSNETFVGLESRIICHETDHLEGNILSDGASLGKRKRLRRRYKKMYNQIVYPKPEKETDDEI